MRTAAKAMGRFQGSSEGGGGGKGHARMDASDHLPEFFMEG